MSPATSIHPLLGSYPAPVENPFAPLFDPVAILIILGSQRFGVFAWGRRFRLGAQHQPEAQCSASESNPKQEPSAVPPENKPGAVLPSTKLTARGVRS